jgi:WD40 repeat protein
MEVLAMRENPTSYKYDAFISYRHSEPDKTIAERLHRMLETFKVPKAIIKKGSQKRVGRVFRDRDELPTSSNLADNIQSALTDSEHLIVICSPRTPQSQWVLKEVETFSALHGHDRILALLIEGEPMESFPEALRYVKKQVIREDGTLSEIVTEIEPLAADIRDKSLAGMKKKLKVEILRLLAPILNCRFDDLKQRHRERLVKRILTISISLSVFFLGFGSITAYQSMLIRQQSEEVREKSELVQQQAEQLKLQVQETLAGQSLYLADVSTRLFQEGDRKTAILVALEALPKNLDAPERPYLEEAEFALSQALQVYKNGFALSPDTALQHDKYVNFIKISPDGNTAVTSAQDGCLYIWETEYGHLKNKYFIDDTYLDPTDLAYIDDSTIACVTSNKAFSLNIETLSILWEEQIRATRCAFSPDKTKLAVVDGGDIKVLDTVNGMLLFEYAMDDHLEPGEDKYKYTSYLNFDESSRYLLIGTSNAQAVVVDLKNQTLVGSYNAHFDVVQEIALNPDGMLAVASLYYDEADLFFSGLGFLDVYNINSHEKLMEMEFRSSNIKNLSFHPDDSSLLIFTEYEKLNVVDLDEKALVYSFSHGDSVSDYIPLEGSILSSSYDGTIRMLFLEGNGYEYENFRITLNQSIKGMELKSGKLVISCSQSAKAFILRNLENADNVVLEEVQSAIRGSHYTRDKKKMLTFAYDGELILWDTETNKQTAYHGSDDSAVYGAFFIDQDSKILSVSMNGKLTLYDAKDLRVIDTYETGRFFGWAVSKDLSMAVVETVDSFEIIRTSDLSVVASIDEVRGDQIEIYPDNSKAVVFSRYSDPMVIDMKTGGVLDEIPMEITYAALSPDGKTLACVVKDRAIHILDAQTYREIGIIDDFNVKAEKLFIDPKGETLFVALDDFTVRRYSLKDLSLIVELEGLQSIANVMTFSEEKDLYAITGSYRETLVYHDSTNKKLAQITNSYVVDPDIRYFICMPSGDTIRVPFYSLRELMEEAQRQLGGRTLTPKEKAKYFIVD